MIADRNKIFTLFNILPDERKSVINLFFHHFFQGFGLALIFIVANALFLKEYSVKELPKVYLLSGFLVLVSGRVYAWFEHHLDIRKLLKRIVLLLGAIFILLWISGQFIHAQLFSFALLCIFQVLYLLYNLEFWGISALVFDVRQSKRLFGLISAGDMPAKMLGYLTVSLFAQFLPLIHLIFIAGIAVFVSYSFLNSILKQNSLEEKNSKDIYDHYSTDKHSTHPINYLKKFFKTRFILVAAILSFLVVITFAIINYSFLSEVKYKFKSDAELATFFGLFFAIGQFITIILKAFFSGRVISYLGVKKGLLILPVSIAIILIISFISQRINPDYKNLLYVYGFLMLFSEIFNYALQQPLFLSLFQPLNAHYRLHGHTVIKGFVDGLGLIVAGSVILILLKIGIDNQLFKFGLLIFGFVALWIIWVFRVDREYFLLLRDAIRIRRLSGSNLQFNDERIEDRLIEKVQSGRPWEVIYSLEILKQRNPLLFSEQVPAILDHTDSSVRSWAIKNIQESHFSDNMALYRSRVKKDISENTANTQFIRRLSNIDHKAFEWAKDLLLHQDKEIVKSVITGLLEGKTIEGMVIAGSRLIELKDSEHINEKLLALEIIEDLGLKNFYGILLSYLKEKDQNLIKKSIITAGVLAKKELFGALIAHFPNFAGQTWYLGSLAKFNNEAINHFVDNIHSFQSRLELESIIYISKLIGQSEAAPLLLHPKFIENVTLRDQVLDGLATIDSTFLSNQYLLELENYLDKDISFLEEIQLFDQAIQAENKLNRLLQLEMKNSKRRIFNCLNLLIPENNLSALRDAYFSHFKNKQANAIESLENLLPGKYKQRVLRVFESNELKTSSTEIKPISQKYILEKGSEYFSDWSIAFCLKQMADHEPAKHLDLADQYSSSSSLIIRQQVNFVNNKISGMENYSSHDGNLLEIEKVSILKGTSLFEQTPEDMLVDLASVVSTVQIEKGEVLFREGDPGDSMYIIYSGKIEVRDDEKTLAQFNELDFFGELSLLDEEPRSATAIAKEDSLLLSISQEDFYELISFRLEVAKSVLRVLSQRLRKQNKS